MKLYENVFIARQELTPKQVETLAEDFSKVVKDQGGDVGKTEYSGLKQLAYPIGNNSQGHYILMNVTANTSALEELERQQRLNEDVIRFLSVAVEKHDSEPSALTQPVRSSQPRGSYRSGGDRGRYGRDQQNGEKNGSRESEQDSQKELKNNSSDPEAEKE